MLAVADVDFAVDDFGARFCRTSSCEDSGALQTCSREFQRLVGRRSCCLPLVKDDEDCRENQYESDEVIPLELFSEI